jgi:hypothetical protein
LLALLALSAPTAFPVLWNFLFDPDPRP